MISIDDLYSKTNEGLDIIALVHPDAKEAAQTGKPFRSRPGERTPSTHMKRVASKNGSHIWKMTDFGGEGRMMSPLDVYMYSKGIDNPGEAILELASIFNIIDTSISVSNRPEIIKTPATVDQEEGSVFWDIDQDFSAADCKVMGPRVTPETLKSLNWYRVKSISSVKNRETTTKKSTDRYPIFMRECWFEKKVDGRTERSRFYKIYEPLNSDKGFRFQYRPKGEKPQEYINGLEELQKAYAEYNDQEEAALVPKNDHDHYIEQKLPEVIICSGERDALCVRALGYHPVWFNSETYQIKDHEMAMLRRYAEIVYNIPDIDKTGIRKGRELALRYIDVHTVWLPDKLSRFRDSRGNPRKDFRDWCEIYDKKADFKDLLELAAPVKFWYEIISEKTGVKTYKIDVTCLFEFLRLNGFYVRKDNISGQFAYIKVDNYIVEEVEFREIKNFILQWCKSRSLPRLLRNAIINSTMINEKTFQSLDTIDLNFSSSSALSQFFYFPKFAIEITPKGLKRYDSKQDDLGRHIWRHQLVDHDIRILEPMFEITHEEGCYLSSDFDINIFPHRSCYFNYLINSSRLHWRKELEESLASRTPEEAEAYRKEHKFDIAGPNLSEEEIAEQKRCLINKIFTIGYMLHNYKSKSRAWAPFLMDNIIGESGQCNGGSGKSFMLSALKHMSGFLSIPARDPRLLENKHWTESINHNLGMIVLDDCHEYFPFQDMYPYITEDFQVNPKNVSSYTLSFEDAPKFAFNTNYVPREFSGSTTRRLIFGVTSDYYHSADNNEMEYRENRTIKSDFGKNLCSCDYTEAEWEADINFWMQCVRFYLEVATYPVEVKIEPDMVNVKFRKYLQDMSENFREWAEMYFSESNTDHLNTNLIREEVFEAYKRYTGLMKTTAQGFMKSMKAFCYTSEHIDSLNPEDLVNSGNRILKRIVVDGKTVQKEMIHIRTVAEALRLKEKASRPKQMELPWET